MSMGRAARWLRGLLGGKKASKEKRIAGNAEKKPDKSRWSFSKAGCDRGVAPVRTPEEASWLSSEYSEREEDQSKRAIAVAAATAAAADAAVAAAKAAAVVVHLTSHGRSMREARERLSAVKIQTVFRSYLARKALRALRALVKLQALVRGYLVRKQAATTLHCMEALIRAQATARAQRSRHSLANDQKFQQEFRHRRSLERFGSENPSYLHRRRPSTAGIDRGSSYYSDRSPKTVEIDTYLPNLRCSSRTGPDIADELPPVPVSSPLNYRPPRIAVHGSYYDSPNKCRGYSNTTHSTPRYNAAPQTPLKSPGGAEPGYMAKTTSFAAKTRSQSAPKQRPETPRRKEMMIESRASLSGVERCYKVQEGVDRSVELGRELYFENKW